MKISKVNILLRNNTYVCINRAVFPRSGPDSQTKKFQWIYCLYMLSPCVLVATSRGCGVPSGHYGSYCTCSYQFPSLARLPACGDG